MSPSWLVPVSQFDDTSAGAPVYASFTSLEGAVQAGCPVQASLGVFLRHRSPRAPGADSWSLRYYRARYYDSTVGRFLSEDPIQFDGGNDFYVYALNDPVDYTDPSGLKTSVCCRPLRYLFGKLGFTHCYVRMNIHGGPVSTYGLHREDAKGVLYPGGPKAVINDVTDVGGTCKDVADATPCKENALAQDYADQDCPSCGANYFFLTSNSNNWVSYTLRKFGMTPPYFGPTAPGYDPLPSYYPPFPPF